jgi:serine/threonine-protein kinase
MPARKLNAAVPRTLERILARCMEKMPANRYPSTQALIDDLMEFLAARVPINYSARLVMYLRDTGVVPVAEAEEILAAGASRAVRPAPGDRRLLRSMALVQGALCLGIVGAGAALQYGAGRLQGERGDDAAAAAGLPVEPERAGHVRFVVEPWADVYIDGQQVLTTPSARAIPLAPGRHYVKLKNPYFAEVDRELRVVTGRTEVVDVTLEPLHAAPQRPAVPGGAP